MPNLVTRRSNMANAAKGAMRHSSAGRQAFADKHCAALADELAVAALQRHEGWAIRTGLEICGWVGTDRVVDAFLEALGVRDQPEAQSLVGLGRQMQALADTTAEDAGDKAVEVLRLVAGRVDPETRRRWLASLSGLWPDSEAVESHQSPDVDRVGQNGSGHGPDD